MLAIVLIFNFSIALACLYATWQVWHLRRTLAQVTASLHTIERDTYALLHAAPAAIAQGQIGTRHLRRQYQKLQPQLQQAQQLLAILSLGQWFYRQLRSLQGPPTRLLRPTPPSRRRHIRRGV
ncbi:hypothetical protein [Neosynechococcus sphagnicola]|uniref:hypothetical protein n=1 Tax=Neosynechococcus sphagnicola TaxID=1501145 RepID=UPI00068E5190|nr:hypothetical protein [Neosynechococcus sphagnicola]